MIFYEQNMLVWKQKCELGKWHGKKSLMITSCRKSASDILIISLPLATAIVTCYHNPNLKLFSVVYSWPPCNFRNIHQRDEGDSNKKKGLYRKICPFFIFVNYSVFIHSFTGAFLFHSWWAVPIFFSKIACKFKCQKFDLIKWHREGCEKKYFIAFNVWLLIFEGGLFLHTTFYVALNFICELFKPI